MQHYTRSLGDGDENKPLQRRTTRSIPIGVFGHHVALPLQSKIRTLGEMVEKGQKTRHHHQKSKKCTTPHSEVIEKHGGEGPKTPRYYHQKSKKCTTPHSEVYYEECNY